MKRICTLLLVALIALGCSDPKPIAKLRYTKLTEQPSIFAVEFDSDINLEELFAKNKHQKIVVKKLMCPLGDDQNFDVEHNMQHFFRGGLQLQGATEIGERTTYRYLSRGYFYENTPGRTDMKFLSGAALAGVLGSKKSVPCKVIMTVYMSSPYYSETMSIPVEDILRVTKSSK